MKMMTSAQRWHTPTAAVVLNILLKAWVNSLMDRIHWFAVSNPEQKRFPKPNKLVSREYLMSKAKWRVYEELAQSIINELAGEFGLDGVEGKQTLHGKTGTHWEIDAKGIREGNAGIILIECRRYPKRRIKQEQMAAIAYRINDIGSVGGITVSPLEPQEGLGYWQNMRA
ncbi:hypothetical protein BZL41_21895 [Pseudomonas sp. PIC25]|uniref:hypothetical protein n=1 Tax=Pseudomonas sp. PIC25 TaxID=1958773 RepID=UPI000BABB5CC|nr:hypothetical protein [Pseudomonas sp. PIC25]PAU54723.1 hypothetical protein BZL41_21895 [Pseudomonas sp. PIC25]